MKKKIRLPAEVLEQLDSYPEIKEELSKLMDDEGGIETRGEVWNREEDERMEMGMNLSGKSISLKRENVNFSSVHSLRWDERIEGRKANVEMQLKGLKILSDSIKALNSIVRDERLERLLSKVEAKIGVLIMEKTLLGSVKTFSS